MTPREKAIDRIRKLLAISTSTTHQAEAETALATAQKLMLEFQLSGEEIERRETSFDASVAFSGSRLPAECYFILPILSRHFFCRGLFERSRYDGERWRRVDVLLFGSPENRAMGCYVFAFLRRVFRDLARLRFGQKMTTRQRKSYYEGLYTGFHDRLEREHRERVKEAATAPGSPGLIVIETQLKRLRAELSAAYEAAHPDIKAARDPRDFVLDVEAAVQGIADGRQIELRKPVGGEATPQAPRLEHSHS